MTKKVSPKTCRGVRRGDERRYNAFTLIELILVVGIIIVLAGLVLSTVGYARKKGARARAETEIAAMSAACENYKADNGVYPEQSYTRYTDCTDDAAERPIRHQSTYQRHAQSYTSISRSSAG